MLREQGGRHFPSRTPLYGFSIHCTTHPRLPRFTPAPRVQDEPVAKIQRELADPAVGERGRSRCSSACSR